MTKGTDDQGPCLMKYLVGIDEAGYGPNLGPLVQAGVAVRAPDGGDDLWAALRNGVCRADEADDVRLIIDDSKKVHVLPRGLERLERAVLAVLGPQRSLGQLLERTASGTTLSDLDGEFWYQSGKPLPVSFDAAEPATGDAFNSALKIADIAFTMVRTLVTPAPRFNELLDQWNSKGTILANGLIVLLGEITHALPGTEPIQFVIDKHGGRNFYAPIVQTAFSDRWVTTISESDSESRYRIEGLGRLVTLRFIPRADSESLPVALASMIAKYLREVFMQQFNRYWQERVRDLEPTAGYPNDSKRFYGQIQRAMRQLSITERQVWRAR